MKHLSIETCKRLTEAWVLDNVETESIYMQTINRDERIPNDEPFIISVKEVEQEEYNLARDWVWMFWTWTYVEKTKAPNLEEAIDLLPIELEKKEFDVYWNSHLITPYIDLHNNIVYYSVDWVSTDLSQQWETLLEAIEKMLNYLLDNKVIWKKTKNI